MPQLCHLSLNDVWEVRKEATWAIANICDSGTKEQISLMVEFGGLSALCGMLNCHDVLVTTTVLDAISAILKTKAGTSYTNLVEECDGLEEIENLQQHENEGIYLKAQKILEKYFGAEEEEFEDENLCPGIGGDGKTFGFGIGIGGGGSKIPPAIPTPSFKFNFSSIQ